MDERYPELDGIKFCDSCDMYLDNNTSYDNHVKTLKHRNNVRLVNGEIVKNGGKFDCVTCKTTLSQYSVDQHLKTKMHLDNVEGKDLRSSLTDKDIDKDITKDLQSSFTDNITDGFCDVCNTRYNNKKEHSGSDEHKENVKQKKFVDTPLM